MRKILKLIFVVPVVLAGCVPETVYEADQIRISELMAQAQELQNALNTITATQRVLEIVCIVNGLLLALCVAMLWKRRKIGGQN